MISRFVLAIAVVFSFAIESASAQEPYVGEIRMFGGNFAPRGWALCNGNRLPKAQYRELFELIGTTYGGNELEFALPDLRGRAVVGQHPDKKSFALGKQGGTEIATIEKSHLPTEIPTYSPKDDKKLAEISRGYESVLSSGHESNGKLETKSWGASQPVTNMQPYATVNFIIALKGKVPTKEADKPFGDPFIGQIGMFAGKFAPAGWKLCDGKLVPIEGHNTLFSLLQKTYGGDENSFALPDLRGRVPIHAGQGRGLTEYKLGKSGGSETVTLTPENLPARFRSIPAFTSEPENQEINRGNKALITTGLEGNDAHANEEVKPLSIMQPYSTINFLVAKGGQFPVRGEGNEFGIVREGPFLGEIRMFAGDFAPVGWAFCDGQTIQIFQHDALFSLIGTTYGGDGRQTFSLPDMRSRTPIHTGSGPGLSEYYLGELGGREKKFLLRNNMPQLDEELPTFSADVNDENPPKFEPGNQVLLSTGQPANGKFDRGSSKAINNLQPYLPVRFTICVKGRYPNRN